MRQFADDSVDRGEGIDIEGDDQLAAFFDELETRARTDIAAEGKQGQ